MAKWASKVFAIKDRRINCWRGFRLQSLVLALGLLLWPGVWSFAATCYTAPTGMVSWWTADSTAADVTGTNNGTLIGTVTAGAPGMVGGGFTFDGTNGNVQIPDSPLLKPTNLTVEAWVRFTALDSLSVGGSPPGDQYIVFKQNTRGGDFEGYDLSKTRVAGNDVFRFLVSSAAGVGVEVRSTTVISTGVWYHVAGVRGSNFTQIYVNGQLQRQTNVSFPQDYGNLPLFLGSSGNAGWDHRLRGNLDEATLFNRALSPDEIASLFTAGSAGKCKAVTLTSQPTNQSVVIGGVATFTVSATGLAPLSYRWTFNGTTISGATSTSLTIANVQTTNGGNYAAVVSNSFGAVASAAATLTVLIPPAITTQPSSTTNVVGTSANFSVAATGTPSPAYQWRFNGVNISGATASSLTVPNVQTSSGGNYTVVASNIVGVVTSSVAVLTVWVPAAISAQPQSQTNVTGTTANFSVTATGTPAPAFQWQFNGAAIAGATDSSLAIPNVQTNNGGNYTVVVTNSAGNITSAVAVLTIWVPPAITTQPQSQTNVSGTTANFNVIATGTPAPAYQWQFNGAPISGATTASLSLPNTQPTDGGDYSVVVSNAAGSITSSVAALTIWVPPAITTQPQSQTNVTGTTANFSVTATGTPAAAFQWQFNGAPITGATDSSLAIPNVQTNNGGNYTVVVTNSAGTITSAVAVLTIWVPPAITAQPQSQTNVSGTTAGFNVIATGTPAPAYQWQFNGVPISGATTAGLSLPNVQPINGGNYSVVASNAAGSITSSVAVLTIWVPPAVTSQPQSQTNVSGSTANFSVLATGAPAPALQWQFNGAAIAGATEASLAISNVQTNNGGSYSVVVTNSAGALTSTVATLTIWVAPSISSHPQSQTNVAGNTISFNVVASGIPTPTYQWRFFGTNLSGATDSSLTLTNITPAVGGGYYTVVASNSAGAVTSSAAFLSVSVQLVIVTQPKSQTNLVGDNVVFTIGATGAPPPSLQWQFKGVAIPGATISNYTIASIRTNDDGPYTVVLTNLAGSATSAVAALKVLIPVQFPDINLEDAVRAELRKPEGTLTRVDLARLTSLVANDMHISSLSGLEWATNMTNFYAGGNVLGDISPLSSLRQLTSLFLHRNTITNLAPLAGLTNLTFLELRNNPGIVSFAPLSGLLNLNTLSVGGNAISNLTFAAGLGNLSFLGLDHSQLSDESVPPLLPGLTGLDVSYNPLSTSAPILAFGATNLTSLYLSGTTISNLNFLQSFPGLSNLFIYGNSIYGSSFGNPAIPQGLTKLTSLNLGGNPEMNAYPNFATLTNLANLWLYGNKLGDASVLSSASSVTMLDLHNNGLTTADALAPLAQLKALNLENNQITNITGLSGLSNLSSLGMAGNLITNLGPLSSLLQLTQLGLANNRVLTLQPLSSLTNLLSLDASLNPIANYNGISSLSGLLTLSLTGNSISNSSFLSGLTSLTSLDLRVNRVASLSALTGLTNLAILRLGSNLVADASLVASLPRMSTLDLGRNPLSQYGFLSGMTNLSELYLNGVSVLDPAVIGPLPQLSLLDVSQTRLSDLAGLGALNRLHKLVAAHNKVTALPSLTSLLRLWEVDLRTNLLDITSNSVAFSQIQTLISSKVTVSYIPQNQPPVIVAPNYWPIVNTGASLLSFTVNDDVTPLTALVLASSSSNPALISSGSIVMGGTNENRTLTVTPSANPSNTTTITLTVTDDTAQSASTTIQVVAVTPTLVNIPDTNLLFAVRTALNRPTGQLSNVDLLLLTTLRADGSNIVNLTGLEYATNLVFLSLANNHVASITPLQGLPNLALLNLNNNPLGSLTALASLPKLTQLQLDSDRITSLSFLQGISTLTSLSLMDNRLTNINILATLPPLNSVNLVWNLLNTNAGSAAMFVITNLGTAVTYDPQIFPPSIFVPDTIAPPNLWVIPNNTLSVAPLTVLQYGNPTGAIFITVSSSNPLLFPPATLNTNRDVNGNWRLNVQAPANQGNATLTLTATDELGLVGHSSILVTVAITQTQNGQGVNQPNLAWSSWGDATWFDETTITHDGFMASQSGAILDNRQTLLGTTVNGPGRLSFWWKVSSEPNYDFLEFYINGALQNRISGLVDWQQVVCNVPSGTNTMYWRYMKDPDTTIGLDAGWLDEVVFTPGVWLEPVGLPVNGVAQLLLHGVPGHQYEVQVSSNLVNWTQLLLLTPTNTATPVFDFNAKGTRFYRLHEVTFGTIWFEQPVASAGAVRLALHSPKNTRLELQASSDLVGWSVLANVTNCAGTARYTNALTTNALKRFYRAKLIL